MVERGPGRPTKYRLKDGTIVPSVTTICNRFKDSGGLLHWAYKQGELGVPLYEARDKAGDVGSKIHDFIEKDIAGELPTTLDDPQIQSGVMAWQKWKDRWIEKFLITELPLVSEEWRYGGTFDALGIESGTGKTVLVDWKTSGGIYTENLVQLAAYAQLLSEVRNIKVEGFHLVRFSKSFADLEHRHYDNLAEAWDLFGLYLEAFVLDKHLAKRAR